MERKCYGSVVIVGCTLPALMAARVLTRYFPRIILIEPRKPDDVAETIELLADLRTHPQARFVRADHDVSVLLNPDGTCAVGVALNTRTVSEPSAVIADLVVDARSASTSTSGRRVDHLIRLPAASTDAIVVALDASLVEQQQAHRNGSLLGMSRRFESYLQRLLLHHTYF